MRDFPQAWHNGLFSELISVHWSHSQPASATLLSHTLHCLRVGELNKVHEVQLHSAIVIKMVDQEKKTARKSGPSYFSWRKRGINDPKIS